MTGGNWGGMEFCVYCWVLFGGEDDPSRHVPHPSISAGINYTHGPVVHAETGTEYDHVGASEPGTPLAHPDCRKKWKATTRPDEEISLTAFSTGDHE